MMHLVAAGLAAVLALVLPNLTAAGGLDTSLTYREGEPPAPDLALPDLDGAERRLVDLRGKVVLVNFWATWCPPCVAELPTMQRAYEELGPRGFEVLAVNLGEDGDTVRKFLRELAPPVSFTVLLDEDHRVFDLFGVRGLPTSYLIDPRGKLVYSAEGGRDVASESIRGKILELMAR